MDPDASMLAEVAVELRRAARECQERGILHAARWAAQQLAGMELPAGVGEGLGEGGACAGEAADVSDADAFAYARALFDAREYRSAAHVLEGRSSARSHFLRLYCRYLSGERRRREADLEGAGAAPGRKASNAELAGLEMALQELGVDVGEAEERGEEGDKLERALGRVIVSLDGRPRARRGQPAADAPSPCPLRGGAASPSACPYLLYLSGLVQLDRGRRARARRLLAGAARLRPGNWGAWKALVACYDTLEEADEDEALSSVSGPFRALFLATLSLELHRPARALAELSAAAPLFPRSAAVPGLAARAHYSLRDFDAAQALFEDALSLEPERVEDMDAFSNVLYVREDAAGLARLTDRLLAEHPRRPETLCALGNRRGLAGDHARAAACFGNAIRVDPTCVSAWTLLGHELVELKAAPAACGAYRAALDANPRDYRAWFGLGQAYELMGAKTHALRHFAKAVAINPDDARLWNALGGCYAACTTEADRARAADAFALARARAPPGARDDDGDDDDRGPGAGASFAARRAAPLRSRLLPQLPPTSPLAKAIACRERALRLGDPEGLALEALAELYEQAGCPEAAAACHSLVLEAAQGEAGAEGDGEGDDPSAAAEGGGDPGARRAARYLERFRDLEGDEEAAVAYRDRLVAFVEGEASGPAADAWAPDADDERRGVDWEAADVRTPDAPVWADGPWSPATATPRGGDTDADDGARAGDRGVAAGASAGGGAWPAGGVSPPSGPGWQAAGDTPPGGPGWQAAGDTPPGGPGWQAAGDMTSRGPRWPASGDTPPRGPEWQAAEDTPPGVSTGRGAAAAAAAASRGADPSPPVRGSRVGPGLSPPAWGGFAPPRAPTGAGRGEASPPGGLASHLPPGLSPLLGPGQALGHARSPSPSSPLGGTPVAGAGAAEGSLWDSAGGGPRAPGRTRPGRGGTPGSVQQGAPGTGWRRGPSPRDDGRYGAQFGGWFGAGSPGQSPRADDAASADDVRFSPL